MLPLFPVKPNGSHEVEKPTSLGETMAWVQKHHYLLLKVAGIVVSCACKKYMLNR